MLERIAQRYTTCSVIQNTRSNKKDGGRPAGRQKTVGVSFRFQPGFASYIRNTARRKNMPQVKFLEACVAENAKGVKTGVRLKFIVTE